MKRKRRKSFRFVVEMMLIGTVRYDSLMIRRGGHGWFYGCGHIRGIIRAGGYVVVTTAARRLRLMMFLLWLLVATTTVTFDRCHGTTIERFRSILTWLT